MIYCSNVSPKSFRYSLPFNIMPSQFNDIIIILFNKETNESVKHPYDNKVRCVRMHY